MKKNVIIKIIIKEDNEFMNFKYEGTIEKNLDRYIVKYEEKDENNGITNTILKIHENKLIVEKMGIISYEMTFKKNYIDEIDYKTQYGNIKIINKTIEFIRENKSDTIDIKMKYSSDLNNSGERIIDFNIAIEDV